MEGNTQTSLDDAMHGRLSMSVSLPSIWNIHDGDVGGPQLQSPQATEEGMNEIGHWPEDL